jgi:hypothetical protein
MWELMTIGIEMQKRMIEVHAKGLEMTGDMLREMGEQGDAAKMLEEAARAQGDMVDQWMNYWKGRP